MPTFWTLLKEEGPRWRAKPSGWPNNLVQPTEPSWVARARTHVQVTAPNSLQNSDQKTEENWGPVSKTSKGGTVKTQTWCTSSCAVSFGWRQLRKGNKVSHPRESVHNNKYDCISPRAGKVTCSDYWCYRLDCNSESPHPGMATRTSAGTRHRSAGSQDGRYDRPYSNNSTLTCEIVRCRPQVTIQRSS